jgi:hypothetical protein
MSATVIPFPSKARAEHVDCVAWQLWRLRDDVALAEEILTDELDAMRFKLARRGIGPSEIERDLTEFETAVRQEVVRQTYARSRA